MTKLTTEIQQLWWKFTFNIRMKIAAKKYPNAGYYELILRVNGFDDEKLNELIGEALMSMWIDSDTPENREEVFQEELLCWGD